MISKSPAGIKPANFRLLAQHVIDVDRTFAYKMHLCVMVNTMETFYPGADLGSWDSQLPV